MNATISEADGSSEAGAGCAKTDWQLMDRFVADGDQSAFAELVARHSACVWAVCRRVLGQEQDAEDAFQAVFLVLGRKAGTIRKRKSVGSWLYGAAYHTATKVRRAAARRKAREQQAGGAAPEPRPPDQAAARELQRLLDEEVARLAEKYQAPFVLCCLKGRTRVEAAQELGWSEGTVSSRLAQARALLQKRLAQRGFTLSAVLTAWALAEGSAAAAPLALVQAAVQAGVVGNAAPALSPFVMLADSIVRALMVIKLKTALAASLVLALVMTAAGIAAYQVSPAPEEGSPVVPVNALPTPSVARFDRSDVWSAAISRDGKLAAAGAGRWDLPGEVGIWDLSSRKLLMHAVEKKGITSVAFCPDGKLLASASCTGNVRLRDVPSGKDIADFKIPVSRIAFSPDGSLLAAACEAKIVRLVDVANRKVLGDLEGDLFRFHCVAFSPDGKRLLAGGGDWQKGGVCQVTIWDVESRKQVSKLIGHELAVLSITYSPDGKTIATGAADKTIRLWNADTGVEIKILRGHDDRVESLTFSLDGKTLVSGGLDGSMRFWDVESGQETAKLGGDPRALANAPLKAGDDHSGSSAVVAAAPWSFSRSVRAICFTPDGASLLVGGGPRTLRRFDVGTHKETAVLWEVPPPNAPLMFTAAQVQEAKQSDGGPAKGDVKAKPPPRQWPEHVDIQFNKGLQVHPDLRLFGPDVEATAKVEPQGLRFMLPAGRDDATDVGVESRRILRGDFEITLAYELLALPDPAPQGGAGVMFEARFDTPDDAKANITRTQKNQSAFFGSSYFAVGDNGKLTRHPLSFPRANDKVRMGRLRLERTGTSLAFQVDEGSDFRTIATRGVGDADVVSVRAMVTSNLKPLPVEIRFTHLDMRWHPPAAIVTERVANPLPSRIWLLAAVLMVAVIVLFLAGMLIVRYRRGTDQGLPRENNIQNITPQPRSRLACPACQRKIKVKAEQAGKKVKCPHCAAAIEIPRLQAELLTPKEPRHPESDSES